MPALLAILLIMMLIQFVFGELGVQRSYARSQRINQLRHTIARLQQIKQKKHALITGLSSHDPTIAYYARNYGLTGGRQINGAPLPDPSLPPLEPELPDRRPFLFRHPELLLLAVAIAFVLITGYFLWKPKKAVPERNTASHNRLTNPSWN